MRRNVRPVDTDHPHLVNFPWRGPPPHERLAVGPHGPLKLRGCAPPELAHVLGGHRPGHVPPPPLHGHVQPAVDKKPKKKNNNNHITVMPQITLTLNGLLKVLSLQLSYVFFF